MLSYRFSRGVQVTKGSLPRGPVTCAGRRPSPGSSAAVLGQPKVPVGPGFASLAGVGDQVGAGRRLGGRQLTEGTARAYRLGGPTGAKPTPEPVEVWVAVGSTCSMRSWATRPTCRSPSTPPTPTAPA